MGRPDPGAPPFLTTSKGNPIEALRLVTLQQFDESWNKIYEGTDFSNVMKFSLLLDYLNRYPSMNQVTEGPSQRYNCHARTLGTTSYWVPSLGQSMLDGDFYDPVPPEEGNMAVHGHGLLWTLSPEHSSYSALERVYYTIVIDGVTYTLWYYGYRGKFGVNAGYLTDRYSIENVYSGFATVNMRRLE